MATKRIFNLITCIMVWSMPISECVLIGGGFGQANGPLTTTTTTAKVLTYAAKTDDTENKTSMGPDLSESTTDFSTTSSQTTMDFKDPTSSLLLPSTSKMNDSAITTMATSFMSTFKDKHSTPGSLLTKDPSRRTVKEVTEESTTGYVSTRNIEKLPTTTEYTSSAHPETTSTSIAQTTSLKHVDTSFTSGTTESNISAKRKSTLSGTSTISKNQTSISTTSTLITDMTTQSFPVTESANVSTNDSYGHEHGTSTASTNVTTSDHSIGLHDNATTIPSTKPETQTSNNTRQLSATTTKQTSFANSTTNTVDYASNNVTRSSWENSTDLYASSNVTLSSWENSTDLGINSTVDPERLRFMFTDDDTSDSFWPVVMALTIVIPSVIVFGVTITVLYRRRMSKPRRPSSTEYSQM